MHIFISYAKKDTRELALKLHEIFNSLPTVTAWMDDSLEYGASWAQQIANHIKRCDLFVVLISEDVNREETPTQDRSFVLTEIDYAKYEFRKPILPVLVQKTPLPIQLAGAQYIDFTRNQGAGLEKLVKEVCKRAGIETPRQGREREQRESQARQKAYDDKQRRLNAKAEREHQSLERKQRESFKPQAPQQQMTSTEMSNPTLLVKRVIALILDSLVLGVVNVIVTAIAGQELGSLVSFVIGIVYTWYFLAHNNGQTPGKMLLGIRVVSNNGGSVSDIQAVLRYVGYVINGFTCGLGYLYALIQPEQRGLHDIIAGTQVVDA